MHPTDRPTRAEFEREVDASQRTGIAPAEVDVVIARDRRGIVTVIEAIGLVALLPLGVTIAALLIWAGRAAIAGLR